MDFAFDEIRDSIVVVFLGAEGCGLAEGGKGDLAAAIFDAFAPCWLKTSRI